MEIAINMLWVAFVIAFCVFCIYGFMMVKDYPLDRDNKDDYIASEYLTGITLSDLSDYTEATEEWVLYIGRDDCKACMNFESKLEPILRENRISIPAYYTSMDRDGAGSKKMYSILKKYKVRSVPTIIVVRNNKLVKAFSADEIKKIERYLVPAG